MRHRKGIDKFVGPTFREASTEFGFCFSRSILYTEIRLLGDSNILLSTSGFGTDPPADYS